jgi:FkbM family methyltransferase
LIANTGKQDQTELPGRVELLWYDRMARSLTHRLPRLAARAVIRIHRLLVGDRLTPIQAANFRIAVSPQDNCGHHLFYYGAYEPLQVALWSQLLAHRKEAVVLDIGANIGFYSLLAAAQASVSRVVSFEPNPLVLPTLRYNVRLNQSLRGKVVVAAVAVGEANGTVRFHRNYEPHNLGLGSMRASTADPFTVDVPIVRLDTYLSSQRLDRVDVIKIDVEGAEHLVIAGLKAWLESHARPTIVIEVHPGLLPDFGSSVPALFATLTEAGYRLRRLRTDGALEMAPDNFEGIAWVLAEPDALRPEARAT